MRSAAGSAALQDRVLGTYLAARAAGRTTSIEVVGRTAADVSYPLDRIADAVLLPWFEEFWPAGEPVLVVSEGLDEPVAFGHGDPQWTCMRRHRRRDPRADVRQARRVEPGHDRRRPADPWPTSWPPP